MRLELQLKPFEARFEVQSKLKTHTLNDEMSQSPYSSASHAELIEYVT